MIVDPSSNHLRRRLAAPARRAVLATDRRIVIVGARGWIGRTAIALLHEALGDEGFAVRVRCFGSIDNMIDLGFGASVPQQELARLGDLQPAPTLLLHLAFLTKDKVTGMDATSYEAANRALSGKVHDALDRIGVDRLFVASSGAAAFSDDVAAADDLRLYGRLKREDENRFAKWTEALPRERRAVIGRIYSVSGPWMNKLETYALASFIKDALAGRPIEVRAPMAVYRSYVAVRELLSLVMIALLSEKGESVLRFDTGGEALELGKAAAIVADVLGGQVLRRPITEDQENRYLGDERQWLALLQRFGMEHLPIADQVAETATWLACETCMPAKT